MGIFGRSTWLLQSGKRKEGVLFGGRVHAGVWRKEGVLFGQNQDRRLWEIEWPTIRVELCV